MADDTLSAPLLRMARLFLVEAQSPRVARVDDVYRIARELRQQGIPVTQGEERLLRQVVWSMLRIQADQEEGELHQALARLACVVLAVIEDDDLAIPDHVGVSSRDALEGLAVQLAADQAQLAMTIGVAIGLHGLDAQDAAGFEALAARLAGEGAPEDALRAARGAALHLRQGEELLARQADPAKAAAHRARLGEARERAIYVIARLLGVPPAADHPVVRANLLRRELRRVEVDALGVVRVSEVEQARRTRELLAWTEDALGEQVTDANRGALADRLKQAAADASGSQLGEDDEDWLFEMT